MDPSLQCLVKISCGLSDETRHHRCCTEVRVLVSVCKRRELSQPKGCEHRQEEELWAEEGKRSRISRGMLYIKAKVQHAISVDMGREPRGTALIEVESRCAGRLHVLLHRKVEYQYVASDVIEPTGMMCIPRENYIDWVELCGGYCMVRGLSICPTHIPREEVMRHNKKTDTRVTAAYGQSYISICCAATVMQMYCLDCCLFV